MTEVLRHRETLINGYARGAGMPMGQPTDNCRGPYAPYPTSQPPSISSYTQIPRFIRGGGITNAQQDSSAEGPI